MKSYVSLLHELLEACVFPAQKNEGNHLLEEVSERNEISAKECNCSMLASAFVLQSGGCIYHLCAKFSLDLGPSGLLRKSKSS